MCIWEAKAQYKDGTAVDRLFEYNENQPESEQQYQIECWLIERHDGCTWYSVDCLLVERHDDCDYYYNLTNGDTMN